MDDDLRLRRATSGDRNALQAVLEDWWPQITVWARRTVGDRDLADEATQEAMVSVVRFIGRYDPARPFGAWLHRVVTNAARDVWRRERRLPQEPLPEVAVHPDPSHHLQLKRAARIAVDTFESLTPRQRELVERVDLRGESAAQVARDLGITSGAVRNQLFTARRVLRQAVLDQNAWEVER